MHWLPGLGGRKFRTNVDVAAGPLAASSTVHVDAAGGDAACLSALASTCQVYPSKLSSNSEDMTGHFWRSNSEDMTGHFWR